MATGPLKRASPASPTEPSSAFCARVFFTTFSWAPSLTKAAPQIGHFRNGQTHVVGHDHGAGDAKTPFSASIALLLLSAVHCGLHTQVRRPDESGRRIAPTVAGNPARDAIQTCP